MALVVSCALTHSPMSVQTLVWSVDTAQALSCTFTHLSTPVSSDTLPGTLIYLPTARLASRASHQTIPKFKQRLHPISPPACALPSAVPISTSCFCLL